MEGAPSAAAISPGLRRIDGAPAKPALAPAAARALHVPPDSMVLTSNLCLCSGGPPDSKCDYVHSLSLRQEQCAFVSKPDSPCADVRAVPTPRSQLSKPLV